MFWIDGYETLSPSDDLVAYLQSCGMLDTPLFPQQPYQNGFEFNQEAGDLSTFSKVVIPSTPKRPPLRINQWWWPTHPWMHSELLVLVTTYVANKLLDITGSGGLTVYADQHAEGGPTRFRSCKMLPVFHVKLTDFESGGMSLLGLVDDRINARAVVGVYGPDYSSDSSMAPLTPWTDWRVSNGWTYDRFFSQSWARYGYGFLGSGEVPAVVIAWLYQRFVSGRSPLIIPFRSRTVPTGDTYRESFDVSFSSGGTIPSASRHSDGLLLGRAMHMNEVPSVFSCQFAKTIAGAALPSRWFNSTPYAYELTLEEVKRDGLPELSTLTESGEQVKLYCGNCAPYPFDNWDWSAGMSGDPKGVDEIIAPSSMLASMAYLESYLYPSGREVFSASQIGALDGLAAPGSAFTLEQGGYGEFRHPTIVVDYPYPASQAIANYPFMYPAVYPTLFDQAYNALQWWPAYILNSDTISCWFVFDAPTTVEATAWTITTSTSSTGSVTRRIREAVTTYTARIASCPVRSWEGLEIEVAFVNLTSPIEIEGGWATMDQGHPSYAWISSNPVVYTEV